MSKDVTTLSAHVTGRVQGVSFRYWTKQQAQALGITGWVKNEPDGSVAALICGPSDAVDTLVAALHDGPPAATVTSVTTEPAEIDPIPNDFRISR